MKEVLRSRRAFLWNGVRFAGAGAMLAGVSLLVLQEAKAECTEPIRCGECGRYDGCDLPRAESARKKAAAEGRQG